MIRPGLRYCKPETAEEAVEAFRLETEAGRKPVYYAGGTEVSTLGRKGVISFDSLINLKGISQTMELGTEQDILCIGSALPLNVVIDSGIFPLFSRVASGVADRTVRNHLSVGGNIAGMLPYREAVLPLLLSEGRAVIAGPEGLRTEELSDCFDKRARIAPGEFFLYFEVDTRTLRYPFHAVRRTGHSSVDYPVIHAAGVSVQGRLRLAVSGLCASPFRSEQVEDVLSGGDVEKAFSMLPGYVTEDIRSSREYRTFLAKKAFDEILKQLEAHL